MHTDYIIIISTHTCVGRLYTTVVQKWSIQRQAFTIFVDLLCKCQVFVSIREISVIIIKMLVSTSDCFVVLDDAMMFLLRHWLWYHLWQEMLAYPEKISTIYMHILIKCKIQNEGVTRTQFWLIVNSDEYVNNMVH